jgi:sulfite oxidase
MIKKDPHFIFHTTDPVNGEPKADKLCEEFITPQSLFYIRNHGPVPQINPDEYRLKINGLLEKPIEISLSTIKKNYQKHSIIASMQCAGNRRDQLIAFADVPGEVPWQTGAIGNAEWSGARLKDILKDAFVNNSAAFVEFMGAEEVIRFNKNVGFGASIPIEKALSDEVLLAYEMNGQPLEPTHGFPLRAVVPGYIGARSVKWLTKITLQAKSSENYFQNHAYQLFSPQANAENVDWASGLQLSELPVNCAITSCRNESDGGSTYCKGYAMSGGGKNIARVDVSTDDGSSWNTAKILKGNERWAWCFWEIKLNLPKGNHEIIARAFDIAANTQPENVSHIWNFKGYMNNAWHRVKIKVE